MITIRPATLLVCAICLLIAIDACELRHGCRIQGGDCNCALGCKSEFPYATKRECKKALEERGSNICARTPCRNEGTCIQITPEPGFKCMCEGTGYYGNRCERACNDNKGRRTTTTHECVVI